MRQGRTLIAALMLAGLPAGASAAEAADIAALRAKAAAGDAAAQRQLGESYRLGRGVPVDLTAARDWYRRAAEQGDRAAEDEYGLLLFRSGRQQDAMSWIARSAERGEARAQYVYGTALFNGDYVLRDWGKAYAMMTMAARGGVEAAANSLAQMERYIPAEQRRAGLASAGLAERPARAAAAPGPATRPASLAPASTPVAAPRAAPAPRPAPASRPAPSPASGGWQVQLGAFGSAAAAETLWTRASARIAALASLRPSYEPAGALTRLRAGPLPDRQAADGVCAAVKAQALACFALKP